ncbi:MAG: penicillin-binding protein 2, partial [Absicoccus sp.]|nr:penicillin-binding protein 2 [Absicoccus sp.]
MPHLRKPSHLHKIRGMDDEISHRILLLSSFIVVLFLVIFIRLIYIQVFSYNDYVQKKDDYTSIRQYVNAPRGQIYDCKGRVLAKTVVSHNIVYTSPKNMSSEDYKLYAKRLVEVFNIDTDDFSETDKKEAYITWKSFLSPSNSEYAANNLLTKSELNAYKSGLWGTNAETRRHQILMKRIGKKQIKEMSAKQLKIAVIYQRMTENASTGQENVILEDVGDDDVAYLV